MKHGARIRKLEASFPRQTGRCLIFHDTDNGGWTEYDYHPKQPELNKHVPISESAMMDKCRQVPAGDPLPFRISEDKAVTV